MGIITILIRSEKYLLKRAVAWALANNGQPAFQYLPALNGHAERFPHDQS